MGDIKVCKLIKAVTGLALCAGIQVAQAAGIANDKAYIDFGPTYTFADSDRDSDNGLGAYLGIGKRLSAWTAIEASIFGTRFPNDGSGRWDEYGAEFDGLLTYPNNAGGWMPYIVGGAGGVHSKFRGTGNEATDPYVAVGVGVFKALEVARDLQLGLRADVRYRVTDTDNNAFPSIDDNAQDVVAKVGAVLFFGGAKAAPAPVVPAPEPKPEPTPEPKPTPKPDEWPLAVVYFDYDKSEIKPEARKKLDAASETIKKLLSEDASTIIDLNGHTDAAGTPGYNMALGERRAKAVQSYLATKGVPLKSLNIVSYGESRPAATNDTAEGRALNRRVEVRLKD